MSEDNSRSNCTKVMDHIGDLCGDSNVVILDDVDIANELEVPLECVKGIIDTLAHVNMLYLITDFEGVGMYMLNPTRWNGSTLEDATIAQGIYTALRTSHTNSI